MISNNVYVAAVPDTVAAHYTEVGLHIIVPILCTVWLCIWFLKQFGVKIAELELEMEGRYEL
jgi:hypothetical protein